MRRYLSALAAFAACSITSTTTVAQQPCDCTTAADGCQACPDAPAATPQPAGLAPLIRIDPDYPVEAQVMGLEGHVDLRFKVDADGLVSGVEVAAAEPAGVFEASAIAAVSRWRYAGDPERAADPVTARLEFKLSDYIWSLTPATSSDSIAAAPPSVSGPRNQCIREQAAFDFGETTEIALINACLEPLLVYGCAQGSGFWACTDSEGRQELLINPRDPRAGEPLTVPMVGGEAVFRYQDRFHAARAPNSEFWWLACGPSDGECRLSANQWISSLNRQLDTVDPQARTTLRLARSY